MVVEGYVVLRFWEERKGNGKKKKRISVELLIKLQQLHVTSQMLTFSHVPRRKHFPF